MALGTLGRAASADPFSGNDHKQLKAWRIPAVDPSYVPAGFKGKVHLDPKAEKYEITYSRAAGALFVFEGARGSAGASPLPKPAKHNNIFKSVASFFNHKPSPNNGSTAGVAGEEEANPNEDVAADSPLIGPTHFKETAAHCASGVSEKGIGVATYRLTGCKTLPDDLVKIYRQVKVYGS
jgi:hypothetical protein